MADYYQLRLYNPNKKFLLLFDGYETLDIVRKLNGVGVLEMEFSQALPLEFGSIIQVERSVNGGAVSLFNETVYTVNEIIYSSNGVKVVAYDCNDILRWRIVAFNAETPFSDKTLPADDFIKALARENFGAPIDGRRKLDIRIANDTSQAPVITQQFSRDKLLNSFITLCDASADKGTKLYFDITSDYEMNLSLRTYIGQRGIDRRAVAINENHLTDIELDVNYTEWATVVYSGGEGDGADREVAIVVDEEAVKQTSLGWREMWVADQDLTKPQALYDAGQSALFRSKPAFKLSGKLIDAPSMAYGIHYNFGDLITVEYAGYSQACLVDTVNLSVSGGKSELSVDFVA